MTSSDILQQLQALGSEQTRKTYARHGITGNVYGVSFANLGALKKQIKQNHEIARQLWQSGNFDARCLALMIADPAHITRPELEQWISDVDNATLADLLAGYIQKTAYAQKYADLLIKADNEQQAIIGWSILAAMALNDTQLPDSYFETYLMRIQSTLQTSKNDTKHAMNKALIAIGSRNKALKEQALSAARALGKVVVDHGQTACKTPDACAYIEKVWSRKKD